MIGLRFLVLTALFSPLLRPQAPPTDTLVSPEVHADRRVTFRIRAPKASEVTLAMDYMPANTRERMTKATMAAGA